MTTKLAVAVYDDGSGIGHIFKEVSETVFYGLRAMGHDVILTHELQSEGRRTIVFNSNSFASFYAQKVFPAPLPYSIGTKIRPSLSSKTVLYNLEPCESFWLDTLLPLVKEGKHEVWDYSESNVEWWKKQEVNAKYVPIGYVPELTRIKAAPKDIDVLFYGGAGQPGVKKYNPAKPERRMQVLWQCEQAGLRIKHLNGMYGEGRDEWIARSKIVLNVHRSLDNGFSKLETVRVSYLLANGACVVSEESEGKSGLENAVVFSSYEKIADTCVRLVKDNSWEEQGHTGLEIFSGMKETEILKSALLPSQKKPYDSPTLEKLSHDDPRIARMKGDSL